MRNLLTAHRQLSHCGGGRCHRLILPGSPIASVFRRLPVHMRTSFALATRNPRSHCPLARSEELRSRAKMSTNKRKSRRGRRHNQTGRSVGETRFVKLEHWLLKTPAWKALPPACRALYVALSQRYNSFNNGEISMSVREAARELNIAKDTATKAFHELEHKGFIRRNVCGSFNWKLKHATTWVLTEHPLGDVPATKDFVRWEPGKEKSGPKSGTRCPNSGTIRHEVLRIMQRIVLHLGPWTRFCTAPRSQIAARI